MVSSDTRSELVKALGSGPGKRMARRFEEAASAFQAERFDEARKLLAPLARAAPQVPEVRELYGLSLYRLGRFELAMRELKAFRVLSGSTEQNPVLADCHRALGRWADVEALWKELASASPSAELVTEGLIVTAGARADRGDLPAAVRMLERGWTGRRRGRPAPGRRTVKAGTLGRDWTVPRQPRPDDLRRAYALADLYERAGRSPRARELFAWVHHHAPDLADVAERVRALR